MSAEQPAPSGALPCAENCDGCRLGKHACGGASCTGWSCCACQGESSLAIHADADQGGCRDPHVWEGDALLKWYAAGRLMGSEMIAFRVECGELPEDDRLTDAHVRRMVTLQLVCDQARRRYGAPPKVVDVWTGEDRQTASLDQPFGRARWRLDSGSYCYGTGIMNVAAPPSGACLVGIRTKPSGGV